MGAVRVEQHSGGTERDFSSPGEPEQEVSQSNLQRYRENLQRFQEIYGKEDQDTSRSPSPPLSPLSSSREEPKPLIPLQV